MDTLTFDSPVLLRHLTFSEARKMPIDIITLDNVLQGLELTMDKVSLAGSYFIDFESGWSLTLLARYSILNVPSSLPLPHNALQ